MEKLKYKLIPFAHSLDNAGDTPAKENPIPGRPGARGAKYQTLKSKIKKKGQHEIVMQ